jgi:protoheme IX farnesyltransferase
MLREVEVLRRQVASGQPQKPMRLFHWSITYLSLLFIGLSADVLLRSWW